MFKQFFALVRGTGYEGMEAVTDRHALTILRQQIRDCADAVAAARKAVAIAIAQNDQEAEQTKKLISRIEDLESRAVSALEQGRSDLAEDAAQTIAILEAERDTSLEAQQRSEAEIDRLKRIVRQSEMRLREVQRGQRIAAAADKTQRLRDTAPVGSLSALKDAESTLNRLRDRQKQIDATSAVIEEMEQSDDPSALSEKLAEAGCGAPIRSTAADVLARLESKAKNAA